MDYYLADYWTTMWTTVLLENSSRTTMWTTVVFENSSWTTMWTTVLLVNSSWTTMWTTGDDIGLVECLRSWVFIAKMMVTECYPF